MVRCLISVLIILPSCIACQIDSILQLERSLQYDAVRNLYQNMVSLHTPGIPEKLEQLENACYHRKAIQLGRHFWTFRQYHHVVEVPVDSVIIRKALKVIEEARKSGWAVQEAEWLLRTGTIFAQLGRQGPAFDHLLRGYRKSRQLGYEEYPHLAEYLITLGDLHYQYADYQAALGFLRQIIAMDISWPGSRWSFVNALNTTALCYLAVERYDSAVHYFKIAHDQALSEMHDTGYAVIIDGNRAMALMKLGRTEEAVELLKQDFTLSPAYGQVGSAVNAAIELTSISLNNGDTGNARKYHEYVDKHINRNSPRALLAYYKNSHLIRRTEGAFREALLYQDSARILQDTVTKIHDATILRQAKQRVQAEQYLHELSKLEALREKQVLRRNAAVIIILLTGICVVLWYHRRYLRRQKALEIAELQKKLAEEELSSARQELRSFTRMLTEKNALIESIHDELSRVRPEEDTVLTQLSSLRTHSILTEDDWQQFRGLFEKVYPGFFYRMKEMFPGITPADIRLLALTKLKLSPHDMAAMMGITYDAIKKSRRRLRQRIRVSADESLDDIVDRI